MSCLGPEAEIDGETERKEREKHSERKVKLRENE